MKSILRLKAKSWITVPSVILGFVVAVVIYVVIQYLSGLYRLGCVDSAIVSIRTIVNGESRFSQSHPNLGYTCKLADLTSYSTVALGKKNGYVFEIAGCAVNVPNANFVAIARPLQRHLPAFCSDQSGVLKTDYDGSVVNCIKKGQIY